MTHFRSFLFPVFPDNISPLALRPLLISDMVQPLAEGDGGINLKAFTGSPNGLFCAVNAYSEPMLEGDTLDIYWGTTKLFTRVLQADEENTDRPVFFFLPVTSIAPGWGENVYYVLTRKGSTAPDDPSVPLRILVKLDLPGGLDDPHIPGHTNLHIVRLPLDVIANGVDAEWAAKGVPLTIPTYPNIAERDVIQVKWGSAYLSPHEVSAEQAAGTTPIVITASQDDILAGGDSNSLLLHYEVHDQVWNYALAWSQSTTVKVDAGAWRLLAPIIQESFNGVIDLNDLQNNDVIVKILVASSEFELGDLITMSWTGTPQIGKPLINTQTKAVDNIPSILEFKIPYAEVRAIAMGTADVAYVLNKKNGSPPLSSKRTFAEVVGQVVLIPAPVIREVLGDTLEPDTRLATVDIQYPGMANGDVVDMAWLGIKANGTPYLHEARHFVSQGDALNRKITLDVPVEHVQVLENGSLDLFYRVSSDNPQRYGTNESEHLRVKVEKARATLPVPKVVEANPPDVLDPSKVFDAAHVLIEYLGTAKDDILTYYWTGVSPLASTSDWVPITTLTSGKPVRFRVPARYVTANAGQYIKVRYSLRHATTGQYSHSATLDLLIGELTPALDRDLAQRP